MFSFGQPQQALDLPPLTAFFVVFSGFIGIALSHLLIYFAIKRIGVAICSAVNLGSAFITALLSRWINHEVLTPIQWLGGVIIVIGGLFLIRSQMIIQQNK
jgi:drug/metabolite transporter (DMT)-like permease